LLTHSIGTKVCLDRPLDIEKDRQTSVFQANASWELQILRLLTHSIGTEVCLDRPLEIEKNRHNDHLTQADISTKTNWRKRVWFVNMM
jgi:hypothetical protein